jgi:hypothetical protein
VSAAVGVPQRRCGVSLGELHSAGKMPYLQQSSG